MSSVFGSPLGQAQAWVGGMVLVLPFVFIWGLFLAYTVDAIFSFLVISALAPIYILCAAFPSFRGFSINALRQLRSSANPFKHPTEFGSAAKRVALIRFYFMSYRVQIPSNGAKS